MIKFGATTIYEVNFKSMEGSYVAR